MGGGWGFKKTLKNIWQKKKTTLKKFGDLEGPIVLHFFVDKKGIFFISFIPKKKIKRDGKNIEDFCFWWKQKCFWLFFILFFHFFVRQGTIWVLFS